MSLNASNLSVLAYANNFTLWHYTTTDSAIIGTGYFNAASDMLRVNDLIVANYNTGATAATKFYIVTANAGGAVMIAVYA